MKIRVFVKTVFFLVGSYAHLCVKIIPLDHFHANRDGIILNLQYWKEMLVLQKCLLVTLENED